MSPQVHTSVLNSRYARASVRFHAWKLSRQASFSFHEREDLQQELWAALIAHGVSTVALLAGQPKQKISYDLLFIDNRHTAAQIVAVRREPSGNAPKLHASPPQGSPQSAQSTRNLA